MGDALVGEKFLALRDALYDLLKLMKKIIFALLALPMLLG
jgi:hypothetical protein